MNELETNDLRNSVSLPGNMKYDDETEAKQSTKSVAERGSDSGLVHAHIKR